ncbi:hypothetical protein Q3G72_004996 [Acer saccharum]|nr:hypothetical protein Q3G72_015477 [Acer saccharum]KAK1556441.1 hypothetical protein Q3G72_004996 [Acer saccharum]
MEELGGHLSRVSLDELKKYHGEVSLASVGLFFPREIFFEILSWLPVKYLVRCKCVCKQWYKLIEDRSFIMKHFSRSEPVIVYFEDKVENLDVDGTIVREKFRIIDVFAGVILERGDISSFGDIVEEKLNVIVLEDDRKNKWSETNIVIPLTFLKENPDLKKNIVPTLFDNGKLWFCSEHKDSDQVLQFVYNTESWKLTQIVLAGAGAGAAGKRSYTACPSSVITFKRNAIGEDTSTQTRTGPS